MKVQTIFNYIQRDAICTIIDLHHHESRIFYFEPAELFIKLSVTDKCRYMKQIFYIDLRPSFYRYSQNFSRSSQSSILRLPEEITSRSFKTFVQIGR